MGEPICTWAFGSSLRNSSAKDCPAPACVQGDFGLAAGTNSKVISDEENADLAVIAQGIVRAGRRCGVSSRGRAQGGGGHCGHAGRVG